MTRVIVDEVLLNKLLDLTQPIELCDESGQILGRVLPACDLSEYEPGEPPIDEEELQRRERSNERRQTTAELLAYLEKL